MIKRLLSFFFPRVAMGTPVYNQTAWRVQSDTSNANTAGFLNSENVTFEPSLDTTYGVRIKVYNSGDGDQSGSGAWQLQYSKNGGAYTAVDDVSSNVRMAAGADTEQSSYITERLSTTAAGTYASGSYDETDGTFNTNLNASTDREDVFMLQFRSADLANGDTITFRMLASGAVLDNYNQTPTFDIVLPVTASGTCTTSATVSAGTDITLSATGTATAIASVTAAGTKMPSVWLNTTATLTGATQLPVTAATPTLVTFNDPTGGPSGSLQLGVSNEQAGGGEGNTVWIGVTVNASLKTATGTCTASASLAVGGGQHEATGTATAIATVIATGDLLPITASGIATASAAATASNVSRAFGTATSLATVTATATGFVYALGSITVSATVVSHGTTNAYGVCTALGQGQSDAKHLASGVIDFIGQLIAGGGQHEATGTATTSATVVASLTQVQNEVLASGTVTVSATVAATGTSRASGTATTLATVTANGSLIVTASGIATTLGTVAAVARVAPTVWLNSTPTVVGATQMTVTAFSPTSVTFTDPAGAPIGALYLGVTNNTLGGGDSATAWLAVTVVDTKIAQGIITVIGDLAALGQGFVYAQGIATTSASVTSRGTTNAYGVITAIGQGVSDATILASGTITTSATVAATSGPLTAIGTATTLATVVASGQDVSQTGASGTVTVLAEVAARGTQAASGTITVTGSLAVGGGRHLAYTAKGNLLLWSEEIDNNAAWSDISTPIVSPNVEIAPDGRQTADNVQDNSVSYEGRSQQITIPDDDATYCISIRVKKRISTIVGVNVNLTGGTAVNLNYRMDPNTGNSSQTSPYTGYSELSGDWWTFTTMIKNNSSGNTQLSYSVYPAARETLGSSDSAIAQGINTFWGMQVTKGIGPRPYVYSADEPGGQVHARVYAAGTIYIPATEASGICTVKASVDAYPLVYTPKTVSGVISVSATVTAVENPADDIVLAAGSIRTWGLMSGSLYHFASGGNRLAIGTATAKVIVKAYLRKVTCITPDGVCSVFATLSAIAPKTPKATMVVSAAVTAALPYPASKAMFIYGALRAKGRALPEATMALTAQRATTRITGRMGRGRINGNKRAIIQTPYGSLEFYNNSQGEFFTIGGIGSLKEGGGGTFLVRGQVQAFGRQDQIQYRTGIMTTAAAVTADAAPISASGIMTVSATCASNANITKFALGTMTTSATVAGVMTQNIAYSFAATGTYSYTNPGSGIQTAYAGVRIAGDGTVKRAAGSTLSYSTVGPTANWVDPKSAGATSGMKVRATKTSGGNIWPTSDPLNTWIAVTSDPDWFIRADGDDGILNTVSSTLLIEFSLDDGSTIEMSGSRTLFAEAGSEPPD